ncbi:MAG: SUMF1/EgtB/PvdO family nonheme iron enzyme [Caldilineaceae bacterium]|nr:SUMF1/EgtB/PvdO family nonheme iron enzyme [Caldilineaceae bacterium]
MSVDPHFIRSIQAVNVSLGRMTIFAGGVPIVLPGRADLLAYLRWVEATYRHWADQPAAPDPPLYAQADPLHPPGPDAYIATQAAALPMRVSALRSAAMAGDAPAVDLIDALRGAHRTIILGEPGSGKSAALERLAWLTAVETLALPAADQEEGPPLTVPILARLADYQGEAQGLIPLLRGAYNAHARANQDDPGRFLGEDSLRLLLWKTDNVRFVLLLDGLNEFDQSERERGVHALRGHVVENAHHIVHVTCRTADFDPAVQSDATAAPVPGAGLWVVQPLSDDIRHWDAAEGHSDVRAYLRSHLGEQAGRRLYTRIRADERLRDAATIPLLLWMIKEVGGDDGGELPADRGNLLRSFVDQALRRRAVPFDRRDAVTRSLAAFGWRLQQARRLVGTAAELDAALRAGCCIAGDDPGAARAVLQQSGLLRREGPDRYRLLHQLIQEYGAAAWLVQQADCAADLPVLARDEWHRELCILALWLRDDLRTPAYLLDLLGDPAVDVRVRVAAGEVLGRMGDPRLVARPLDAEGDAAHLPGSSELPGRSDRALTFIEPERMVPIPAGTAVLGGDDPEGYDDELPAAPVAVAAFELAAHPVTNAEYACFMAAGGYDDPSLWSAAGREWLEGKGRLDPETEDNLRRFYRRVTKDPDEYVAGERRQGRLLSEENVDYWRSLGKNWTEDRYVEAYNRQILGQKRRKPFYWEDSRFNGRNQPVVGVNWYEAMAYAVWLARVTGRPYRLPTEAEWEWAARRNERRYAWPGEWDPERCNWSGSRLNRPAPIGAFPHGATPDGLHDLNGNVYEWTASLYRPYPYVPGDGREEADAEGLRVMRGGSWYAGRREVRGAYRYRFNPRDGNDSLGYRLARTLS